MMIIGGIAELMFGVKAERRSLESIAKPLTVEDSPKGAAVPAPGRISPRRWSLLWWRSRARASGVGRATAQAFAREGATVGLIARGQEALLPPQRRSSRSAGSRSCWSAMSLTRGPSRRRRASSSGTAASTCG